jgi:hypothetical protein
MLVLRDIKVLKVVKVTKDILVIHL